MVVRVCVKMVVGMSRVGDDAAWAMGARFFILFFMLLFLMYFNFLYLFI